MYRYNPQTDLADTMVQTVQVDTRVQTDQADTTVQTDLAGPQMVQMEAQTDHAEALLCDHSSRVGVRINLELPIFISFIITQTLYPNCNVFNYCICQFNGCNSIH